MDNYVLVILITAFGFFFLAAILLVPVYRFLVREEAASVEIDRMLADEVKRRRERAARNEANGNNHGDKSGNDRDDDEDGGLVVPVA